MLTLNWLTNEDHVVYGTDEELIPLLSKELQIPDMYFDADIPMGANVWIYLGDMMPAYCVYVPWEKEK